MSDSAPSGALLVRLATAACLAVVVLVGGAAPALAHGRGSDATNYRSVITAMPDLDGVTWDIHGGDELLEVTNTSDEELLVYGYDDEPYLRVGPDGVFRNERSPATYLNEDRYAQVSVPAEADAEADPEWVQQSSGQSAAWHDHRTHYMGLGDHPALSDPDQEQVLQPWDPISFRHAGQDHTVEGELRWVPGVSAWPWLGAGLVLALPALAGLRSRSVTDSDGTERWPGLARPAAAVLGGVVVANLLLLVNDIVAVPLPAGSVALAAGQTALFLAIGAFGAVRGWQAGDGAFTALGVGAGAVLVGQGLLYLSALSASQLATVFPDALVRVIVGVNIAQAVPLAAVAYLGTRRVVPDRVEAAPDPAAQHT